MGRSLIFILIENNAEDSFDIEESVTRSLIDGGFEPFCVRINTEAELQKALAEQAWDGVILSPGQAPSSPSSVAEAPYKMIVDDLSEIIVRFTTEGIITFVNPAYDLYIGSRLTRTPPGSLIGQSIWDIMQVKNYSDIEGFLAHMAETRQPASMQRSFIDQEGNTCWVNWKMRALFNNRDAVYAYQAIGDIITEHKLAGEEREHLRRLLSNIIDSMPSIIIAVDTGGLVTQWNAEAARQIGLSSKEATGRPIYEVFPQFANMMDKLHMDLATLNAEYHHRAAVVINGEMQHFNIMLYPLFADHWAGAVIRIDNVTESVLMQEMLIQNEKMMTLGGLAAGMAHEINNPLSGILQAAQNIEHRLSPDLAKNVAAAEQCGLAMENVHSYMEMRGIFQFLAGIRDSGMRAASIISSMLQFSRRSEGGKALVDLASMLDHCIDMAGNYYNIKTGLDFRHIELVRQYAPDLGAVHCAANEIEQVIMNLLKNAVQAMNEARGQEPRGDNPHIILRTRKAEDMAVIEIEDNGPGMSPDVKKRIFEPFFTTRSSGMGTGLGMSVSRFIITENHQGQMEVESEPGRGTRVIIRLP